VSDAGSYKETEAEDFSDFLDLLIKSSFRMGPQSTYFPSDETGLVCLPTQLERTLQLSWRW